jgi:hypothetical protein
MIMTPEQFIQARCCDENGKIIRDTITIDEAQVILKLAREDEKRIVKEKCEKLFRGFLLKAFLKSASNDPFDQEGEFKKLMDKI